MVKKVLSFFLATMLMMSVLSVSASTGTVATSGFDGTLSTTTNEETEVVTYSYTDDVWNITNSGAYRALGTTGLLTSESVALEIVNESAESSNKVLQATQLVGTPGTDFAKNDSSLSTNAVALAENDTVYISFDFKVPAGNTERWMIGAGGVQSTGSWQYRDQTLFVLYNGKIYDPKDTLGNYDSTTGVSYQKDKWYTVQIAVNAAGVSGYIYDETGCIADYSKTVSTYTVGCASVGFTDQYTEPAGAKIQLDNAKMYTVNSATHGVEVVSSPQAVTEATDVNPTFTLKFDQPVNTTGITLTPAGGEPVDVAVNALTPETLQVSATGLAKGETYTLSWANVTGMAGNSLADSETTSVTYATTAINPVTIDYIDNFTGATVTDNTYTSDVWKLTDSEATALCSRKANVTKAIVSDEGNSMLQISQLPSASSKDHMLPMNRAKQNSLAANETVYGIFSFKVPATTGDGQFHLGASESAVMRLVVSKTYNKINAYGVDAWHGGQVGDLVELSLGQWYTAVIKINTTSVSAYIYDANGILKQDHSKSVTSVIAVPTIFDMATTGDNNAIMLVDDSRYMVVTNDNTMELEESSIAANATNVELLDQTVDLKFDMPIADSAVNGITLNGEAVTAVKTAYDSVRVTLPAVLAPNTPYTLSFANVTGMSGNSLYGAKTLSFTTKAVEDDLIVTGLDKLRNNSGDVAPGQSIAVTNVGAAKTDVDFIVAFYSAADKLIGAQWVTDVDFGAQAKAQLQLANDGYVYRGVNGIRVFAFTADSELKPVFSGATYGNLWD